MMNNDTTLEWFRYAKMDLDAANSLNENMQPKPLEIICYYCQQSVEKALKGFLVSADVDPPKTHDLRILCKLCANYDDIFNEIAPQCNMLTVYGVSARYPHEIEIADEDTKRALCNAENVLNFVHEQIIVMENKQEQEQNQNEIKSPSM